MLYGPEDDNNNDDENEDEAIDTARWLDSIGNPAYSEPSESEYM